MSFGKRVAVVTGANKGVGFGCVRGLCKQFDGDVYLTGRNEKLGQEAVKKLNEEGLHPKFHQLDICDKASIERFKNNMQTTYGGIDILVNNAGIAYKQAATEPFSEQAKVTVRTNFWGTLDVCKSLFPLLRPHARVVNVSSRASFWAAQNSSEELKAKFSIPNDMTLQEIEQLMTDFVSSATAGTYKEKGWAETAYGISKVGLNLITFAHQKEFDEDSREDIIINSCCPGYVDTDMTSHKGWKTLDEGADTLIYLALLPPNTTGPKGAFIAEKKEVPFKAPNFTFHLQMTRE